MAKAKGGDKEMYLRQFITDFAIEIGMEANNGEYNKAWLKLWRRIGKLRIFR